MLSSWLVASHRNKKWNNLRQRQGI